MDDLVKFAKVMGVVLVVVLAGVIIGMLGMGGKEVTLEPPPSPPRPSLESAASRDLSTTPATVRPVAPAIPDAGSSNQVASVDASASPTPSVAIRPEASITDNTATNWEERLDEVLASDQPEANKARQLLALFSHAPQEGQVELAQHLSNLVADEDYAPLGAYLTNTASSEDVLDVLLSDLLNRPDNLKLPLLLEVARNPKNPKAVEAKDLLELYLEEDYGTDWARWRTKVDEYLKANPPE